MNKNAYPNNMLFDIIEKIKLHERKLIQIEEAWDDKTTKLERKIPSSKEIIKINEELLQLIPDAHKEYFIERYVNGKTLKQVGDLKGVTRERVRQIVNAAFAKMVGDYRIAFYAYGIKNGKKVVEKYVELFKKSPVPEGIISKKQASTIAGQKTLTREYLYNNAERIKESATSKALIIKVNKLNREYEAFVSSHNLFCE